MNPAELFRQETDALHLAPGDFLFREGEKGALIGEMALIDDSPRTASVVAKTTCRAGGNRSATVPFSRSADAALCHARDEDAR